MQNQWPQDHEPTVQNQRPVYRWRETENDADAPTVNGMLPVAPPPPKPRTTHYNEPIPPAPPLRDSAARERVRRRRVQSRNRGGEWAWVVIALAVFSVVVVMSMSAFVLLRASQAKIPRFHRFSCR